MAASEQFFSEFDVKSKDIDQNGHLRHTMYSEFAEQTRVNFMISMKLMPGFLEQARLGPILFREELIYHREIRVGEHIKVSLLLQGMTRDARKIHLINEIYRGDGIRACTVYTILSWMDLIKRRIVSPPDEVRAAYALLEKAPDYEDM